MNGAYGRILADILQGDDLTASLEYVKKHKEVLTTEVDGQTLLLDCADIYLRLTADIRRLKHEKGENYVTDENYELLEIKRQGLLETGKALIALGKGDKDFEDYLDELIEELENKNTNHPFITLVKDIFHEKYPERKEEEKKQDEDFKEDKGFVYQQPADREVAVRAFRFKRHWYKLWKDYPEFRISDAGHRWPGSHVYFENQDYWECDDDGKTFIRRIAERWLNEKNKPGWSSWYADQFQDKFVTVLKNGNSYPKFVEQLHDLMNCFLKNEEAYTVLIEAFGAQFPGKFDTYKEHLKHHQPAQVPPPSPEKLSAYYAADLFCAVLDGDDNLSNAFKLVQEYPVSCKCVQS